MRQFWRLSLVTLIFGLLMLSTSVFSGGESNSSSRDRHFSAVSAAQAATNSTLSGAQISGPASIGTNQCTAFKLTAIDQNGQPYILSQSTGATLRLFSRPLAIFSASASCGSSTKNFTIQANSSSITFYAEDSRAESFLVQPALTSGGKTIYGTAATLDFLSNGPTPTPSATPTPAGLDLSYWKGCWRQSGGNKYQALDFQLANAATLILQGELYTGAGCNAADWNDQFNDFNTPLSFGGFGYIYWFTHRANISDVSVVWTFSDTNNNLLWSSGCVNYSNAPLC